MKLQNIMKFNFMNRFYALLFLDHKKNQEIWTKVIVKLFANREMQMNKKNKSITQKVCAILGKAWKKARDHGHQYYRIIIEKYIKESIKFNVSAQGHAV